MIGVAGVAVAGHLAVNLGAAGLGVLQFLEDEDGGTVTHDESGAVAVEGEGCVFRILGPGKRLGIGKTGDSQRDGGILGTARDDGIGISVTDGAVGFADGIRAGCTGRYDIHTGTLGVMRNGNLAGGDIGNHGGDEQRGNPLTGRILDHFGRLTVLGGKTADTRTYINAQAERVDIGVFALRLQAGVVHGLVGRRHSVLGEKVLFADKRFVHSVLLRVKILDLAGNPNGQAICREIIDILDSANAG